MLPDVEILRTVFRPRPEAPWHGYVPVLFVVGFFVLLGIGDEGFLGVLHFIALFVIAALQVLYRTLAGWVLLFVGCVLYGVVVLFTPDAGHPGEWLLFAGCGFVPAIALLLGHPFRAILRSHRQSQGSS